MKKVLFLLLTLIFTSNICGQAIREINNLAPFQTVKLPSGVNLILEKSEKRLVKVEAERTILPHVIIDIKDGVMSVYTTKYKWKDSKRINLYVYYDTTIVCIDAPSGNRVRSELPIRGEKLELVCRNGANFYVNVDVDNLRLRATNGSSIRLLGNARQATITLDNGTTLKAYEMEAGNMNLTATLGSSAEVRCTEVFDLNAESDSEIRYKGDPKERNLNVDKGSRAFAQ